MAQIYDEMLHAFNILDALTFDAMLDRKGTDRLITSLLKSQEEKNKIIQELQEEISKRENEMAEFKQKYGKSLEWIDNYFKHSRPVQNDRPCSRHNEKEGVIGLIMARLLLVSSILFPLFRNGFLLLYIRTKDNHGLLISKALARV